MSFQYRFELTFSSLKVKKISSKFERLFWISLKNIQENRVNSNNQSTQTVNISQNIDTFNLQQLTLLDLLILEEKNLLNYKIEYFLQEKASITQGVIPINVQKLLSKINQSKKSSEISQHYEDDNIVLKYRLGVSLTETNKIRFTFHLQNGEEKQEKQVTPKKNSLQQRLFKNRPQNIQIIKQKQGSDNDLPSPQFSNSNIATPLKNNDKIKKLKVSSTGTAVHKLKDHQKIQKLIQSNVNTHSHSDSHHGHGHGHSQAISYKLKIVILMLIIGALFLMYHIVIQSRTKRRNSKKKLKSNGHQHAGHKLKQIKPSKKSNHH